MNHNLILLAILLCVSCTQAHSVKDTDGNVYATKEYGKAQWMLSNLKVTKSRSGEPIRSYIPNNDTDNIQEFGLLYDYKTACQVCAKGWRLPENRDWEALFKFKERNIASPYKDKVHWEGEDNSNDSEFSALPTGYGNHGEFPNYFKAKTYFWSKTQEDEDLAWTYILESQKDSIRSALQHGTYAFSIRCVQDLK